jgi:hypothetical protein
VHAYADAVRLTFLSAITFFIIVNLLIIPVRLPWLGKDRVPADFPGQGPEEDDEVEA